MSNRLFRHELIAEGMISVILLSLVVCVSMISVSVSSKEGSSGFVFASSGVPVSNAMVMASGSEGSGSAITNSLGQYSITEGLKTGNYTVSVIPQGYLSAEEENVPVIAGQETADINFYLTRSGGISGKVTDAVSGLPLQNIMITASTTDGGNYGWYALTDANGRYSIITSLAAGTYNVTALFPEGHVMKSIGGIAVTAGSEVKGVDLALERSGIISGRVTAASDGTPLGNASVVASSGSNFGMTQTNATGYYRISSGMGTGEYMVTAIYLGINVGYVMNVDVTAGAETSNVDISISVTPPQPSGIIMGKVTDTSSKPIPNALVTAEGPPDSQGETDTDQNGDYVISSGLGSGTYTVFASAPGYSTRNVTGVSVTEGHVTSDVNFQLPKIPPAQSGRISGTVQGDSDPIPEFQYPIAIFLVAVTMVAIIPKLFSVKARRYQLSQ
jgi:hypothetical protein